MKKRDLTKGNVTAVMLLFAVPMILGNIMQQCYNLADTWIVGRFVGAEALAAVGSAYTLMTFLNSILIGMCMGSGALFLYQEIHAIVAWFRESFSGVFRNKNS